MKKIPYIIACAFLLLSFRSNAQYSTVGEFGYQASFPMGEEFKDFVSKTSWLGVNYQTRYYLENQRLSLGGSVSWFYFPDKKGYGTVHLDEGGTYTGNTTNWTNIYGLMAVAQYDLKDRTEKSVPFLRAGLGGAYQNQRSDIGIYAFKEDGIQFMMNAEAGVRFSKDGARGLVLAVNWHYLPASSGMLATSFFGAKLAITSVFR